MDGNFKKLKKKFLLGAIIKSAVCGLAAGLFTAGIMLLVITLCAADVGILYCVLAGVGAAVIGGGVAFLFLRPTDKKVARTLDDDYSLDERAQTSLAFSSASGTVVELQREDTGKKLSALSVPVISFAKIWRYLVALVVAVAMVVTGVIVTGTTANAGLQNPLDDNAYAQISEEQKIRLAELIANVQRTKLDSQLREPVVEELNTLAETIETRITYGNLRTAVHRAIDNSRLILSSSATYTLIAASLTDSEKNLSEAISGGGGTYVYYSADKYSDVDAFYKEKMYSAVESDMARGYTAFRNGFLISQETEDEPITDEQIVLLTKQYITLTAGNIMGAVSDSGVEVTDGLCLSVINFAQELLALSGNSSVTDSTTLQNSLNDTFDKYKLTFMDELSPQTFALLMGRFINNALAQIFSDLNISLELASRRPSDTSGGQGSEGGDNDGEQGDGSGGGGTGETTYGSKDEIYDPVTGTYRKYGEVLGEYFAIVQELLGGEDITDEQRNAVRLYFDILYGTSNAGN